MVQNSEMDFVFYSLESGPFDIPALETYMRAMAEHTPSDAPPPLAVRIPPIRDGEQATRERVEQALGAGEAGVRRRD